jgi:hypothetical protein
MWWHCDRAVVKLPISVDAARYADPLLRAICLQQSEGKAIAIFMHARQIACNMATTGQVLQRSSSLADDFGVAHALSRTHADTPQLFATRVKHLRAQLIRTFHKSIDP